MSGPARVVNGVVRSFTQLLRPVASSAKRMANFSEPVRVPSSQEPELDAADLNGTHPKNVSIGAPGSELLAISVWLAGADPQVEALIADKLAAYLAFSEVTEADSWLT